MQAKKSKVILVTLALLLTISSIEALAKEVVLFSEEQNWGWVRAGETLSNENPYEGDFSMKVEVAAAGWINHGPQEIPNCNLFEFEDNAGDLLVDEVFIEFYYDVGTANIDYWEVTFQLGGDWANKISKNDLGPELDAAEGYQLFQILLEDFQPVDWWESMPHTITAMQLGASFPQGAEIWLDEVRITDDLEETDRPVDMLHKLAATWGKIKLDRF